jgi:Flp pilus assembly pilin Flp
VIAGLISLAIVAGATVIGTNLGEIFSNVGSSIKWVARARRRP